MTRRLDISSSGAMSEGWGSRWEDWQGCEWTEVNIEEEEEEGVEWRPKGNRGRRSENQDPRDERTWKLVQKIKGLSSEKAGFFEWFSATYDFLLLHVAYVAHVASQTNLEAALAAMTNLKAPLQLAMVA